MYQPTHLPPKVDLETKAILKKLVKAHSALAELKGVASTIPNENILINTFLILQKHIISEKNLLCITCPQT